DGSGGGVVFWDGGGDGLSWTDTLNWSGDALPASGDDVEIRGAGASVVELVGGTATVNTLLVEAGATLRLRNATLTTSDGLSISGTLIAFGVVDDINSGAAISISGLVSTTASARIELGEGPASVGLTFVEGFDNLGTIEFANSGTFHSDTLTISSITLRNHGTIRTLGDHVLNAGVTNFGTVTTEGAGAKLTIRPGIPGQTFIQDSGNVTPGAGGDIVFEDTGMLFNGGTVASRVAFTRGTLNLINDFSPAGLVSFAEVSIEGTGQLIAPADAFWTFEDVTVDTPVTIRNFVTIAGSGATTRFNGAVTSFAGSSLIIDSGSFAEAPTELIIANGFTNNGAISFNATNGFTDSLTLTVGILVNAVSRTISSAGGHAVNGAVENRGAVGATGSNGKLNFSGAFANFGDITTSAGAEVRFLDGSYTHEGGTLSGQINWLAIPVTLNADLSAAGEMQFIGSEIDGAGTLRVASGAFVVLDGATIGAALSISGNLKVKGDGSATTINGAVSMDSSATISIASDEDAGAPISVTIASGFTNNGTITFGASNGFTDNLTITNGVLLNAIERTITSSGGHAITGAIENRGTVSATGASGKMNVSGEFTNFGTLTSTGGGEVRFIDGSYVHNGGTLSGRLIWFAVPVTLNVDFTTADVAFLSFLGSTISGAGKLVVPFSTSVQLSGATVNTAVEIDGKVTGSATIAGSVLNSGTLAPGTEDQFGDNGAPGLITINAAYTQTAGGTLRLSMAGAAPDTGFSRLVVNGTATLAGSLAIRQIDPFLPASGDFFDVVAFASVSGAFATTTAEDYPGGVEVASTLTGSTVRVTFTVILSSVRWLGGDGDWHDATKWEGGAVPTAIQNAIIDAAGVYTVTLSGTVVVNSLEVFASEEALPTLRLVSASLTTAVFLLNHGIVEVTGLTSVHGQISNPVGGLLRVVGQGAGGPAALGVHGEFTNSGNVELTSTASGISQINVHATGTLLNNEGAQLHVRAGAGGPRGVQVAGAFTNAGTIVVDGGVQFELLGVKTPALTKFTHSGEFQLDPGAQVEVFTLEWIIAGGTLSTAPNTLITFTAGTILTLNSAFHLAAPARWDFVAATVRGTGLLTIDAGATFGVTGSSTIQTLAENRGTVRIEGAPAGGTGPGVLQIESTFANFGTLELTSTASQISQVNVFTDATFLNVAGAQFNVLAGAGGPRGLVVHGDFENEGTLSVAAGVNFEVVGLPGSGLGSFTNRGVLAFASGADFEFFFTEWINDGGVTMVAPGVLMSLISATLTLATDFTLTQPASWQLTRSQINGPGTLLIAEGTTVTVFGVTQIDASAANDGAIFVTGTADAAFGRAALQLGGEFTNRGSVTLDSAVNNSSQLSIENSATFDNAAGGLLNAVAGAGGTRGVALAGEMKSAGSIVVEAGVLLQIVGQVDGVTRRFTQTGSLELKSSSTLHVFNAEWIFSDGTFTRAASASVALADNTRLTLATDFAMTGANWQLIHSTVAGPGSLSVASGATLTVKGDSRIDATGGSLGTINVMGEGTGLGEFGLAALRIGGAFENGSTLTLDSTTDQAVELAIASGAQLTNSETGLIIVNAGAGGLRGLSLDGDLANAGHIFVDDGLTFEVVGIAGQTLGRLTNT
ncbi:MAG TPA: hypothetical protein VGA56_02220, partial [Opitutaceae bacterium]